MTKTKAPKKLYRLTTITPTGETTHQVQEKPFSLQQLQAAVGGWIELVGFYAKYEGKRAEAYVNEEGLLKGLPLNPYATISWAEQYDAATPLHGNIAIKTRVDR